VSSTDDPDAARHDHEHERSLIDRLRGTGVGTDDPNIIGDAGPTDVAPGQDPPLPPLTEELPPEIETPAERLLPSDAGLPVESETASSPPATGTASDAPAG
jgi:hypothetical protein